METERGTEGLCKVLGQVSDGAAKVSHHCSQHDSALRVLALC